MNNNMTQEKLFSLTRAKLIDLAQAYGIEKCTQLNKQALVEQLLSKQAVSVNSEMDEQLVIEDSKYYLGPHVTGVYNSEELPASYGDTNITLMVRDPHWLYAYWEVNSQRFDQARHDLQNQFDVSRKILRVYDITGQIFDGNNANSYFDIEVNGADSWYIQVADTNRSYCVAIGLMTPEGYFYPLTLSNQIAAPPDVPSDVIYEEWIDGYKGAESLPPRGQRFDWEQIYQEMASVTMGCEAASQFSPH